MKNPYIRVFFLSILVLFATSIGYCEEAASSLQLMIKSDKDVYEAGDSINILIELKNISKENIRINKDFFLHRDLKPYFKVQDSDKEFYWLPPPPPPPVGEDSFIVLLPGESITHKVEGLNRHLTKSQSGEYLKPGIYVLSFDYIGHIENYVTNEVFDGWKGTISSNAISITIKGKRENHSE